MESGQNKRVGQKDRIAARLTRGSQPGRATFIVPVVAESFGIDQPFLELPERHHLTAQIV